GQSFVIVAVRRTNPIFAFSIHHEIYVRATGPIWMQRFPVVLGPSSKAILFCRFRVHADDYLAPDGIAIAPRGVVASRLVRSPVDGVQMHRGVQRGQLRAMLDVQSDSF